GTDDALVAEEVKRSLLALRWRGCDAVWVSGDVPAPQAPSAGPLAELGAPVTEPAWTPRAAQQLDGLAAEHRGALQLALAVASGRSVRARELTEILPNDAWLTTLSLDAKGVELTGAASAASTLIPLLENSPRLERVEFSSPVTRGRDNREQFRIRAAWEAGGAVAPTAGAP